MRKFTRAVLFTLALGVSNCLPLTAAANTTYPDRWVRLVVPFAAGGGQDIFIRLLAPILGEKLGQTVVIENKPGAGGLIGAGYVKGATPDGYTLLVGTAATHGMLHAVNESMPYDAEKDFEPIALIANVPLVLVAHSSVGVDTTRGLVDLLKSNPEKYSYASSGTGAPLHLAGELFKEVAGVEAMHVPYKGSGPAMQDLVAGRVHFMFDTYAATNPHVKAGYLKRLGVSSEQRFIGDPDMPTLKEEGYDVVANSWTGIFAPAGTPMEIQQKILVALDAAIHDRSLEQRLIEIGFEPQAGTLNSDGFRAFVQNELKKWRDVVEAANIQRN